MTEIRRIPHGELALATHELQPGCEDAPRLLLVHQLAGSSADWRGAGSGALEAWPGPVTALDFAGHGESEWRLGGAYTPELFAADVDAVLAALGPCAIAGAGIGAYAALLVAGARPDLVPAALLLEGRGLEGGGAHYDGARVPGLAGWLENAWPRAHAGSLERLAARAGGGGSACDPLVLACAADVRPVDYARSFALAARRVLLAEDGGPRPPWWAGLHGLDSVHPVPADLPAALAVLAAHLV